MDCLRSPAPLEWVSHGLSGVAVPWIAPLEWVSHGLHLSMIYKMGMSAEKSWKRLWGFRQLGKVIEGVKFRDG